MRLWLQGLVLRQPLLLELLHQLQEAGWVLQARARAQQPLLLQHLRPLPPPLLLPARLAQRERLLQCSLQDPMTPLATSLWA